MWRNIRDVGALAQKISAVVAPPMDSEDHSNDSENDHSHPDEDDDEGEGSEEDVQESNPFGFMSMITRNIIQVTPNEPSEHSENETETENAEEENAAIGLHNKNIKETPVKPDHALLKDVGKSSESLKNHSHTDVVSTMQHHPLTGNDNDTHVVKSTRNHLSTHNQSDLIDSEPQPLHLKLHREKGSLSPGRSSTKKTVLTFSEARTIPDALLVNSDDDEEDVDSEEDKLEIPQSDHVILVEENLENYESRLRLNPKTNGSEKSNVLDDKTTSSPQQSQNTQVKKGSSLSTDSLLEGDFGRQLREQRRQKTKRNVGDSDGNSLVSPKEQLNDANKIMKPHHRIVEVPKSDSVLNDSRCMSNIKKSISSDDEDELEVARHGERRSIIAETVMHNSDIPVDIQHSASSVLINKDSSLQATETNSVQNILQEDKGVSTEDVKMRSPAEANVGDLKNVNGDGSVSVQNDSAVDVLRMNQLELHCQQIEHELTLRKNEILLLKQEASEMAKLETIERDKIMEMFKAKEERLLLATEEDHQNELTKLENEMTKKIQMLQQELYDEKNSFQGENQQIEFLLDEAKERAEKAERVANQLRTQSDNNLAQVQQQHARVLRITEDKLVQALAKLDEKDENERNLKASIQTLKSKMNEHHEGAQEVEDELEEIHAENERLGQKIEKLENENKQLRVKAQKFQADSEKLSHVKLEMMMLKEDNEREKAKRQNVTASAESTNAQLVADRDSALAEAQDLQQQLAAALADVEIAKSDSDRIATANNNLQGALEAFQLERDAEYSIWQENKTSDEEALKAAHSATLSATIQMHEIQMQRIQEAADAAVVNSMKEIKQLEGKVEMYRTENIQMRRSLDEAINRLQATQDDVIDRVFMKNVLFDWLTKKGVKERRDVLELMASILHFTEEEKEQVHIGQSTGFGLLVGPPQAKADMEHLGGDNVREKFINFLMAETED